ncbi:hypothetical protein [Halomonas sp. M4R1S46]|uniref:hypothetical protein n=1 Tax=Halomonas sp. M4R1S46 TaxID=2982692 RepID=UPI0021E39E3A|nr:hypothetical protein [Halomonas sp. M4R1S46]UYG09314.1 hypothetical protein OCT48_08295 [Halomonas sp. M4R1S46]
MKSEKSYKKFQVLYEFILPFIGLTALYRWEGSAEIKVVLTLVVIRSCYSWSEMAALEKGFVYLSQKTFNRPDDQVVTPDLEEPEINSWAEFIGLVFQLFVTIALSLGVAWLL